MVVHVLLPRVLLLESRETKLHVELDNGSSLQDVLRYLKKKAPARVLDSSIVLLDKEIVGTYSMDLGTDLMLSDGDEITLIVPVSGG